MNFRPYVYGGARRVAPAITDFPAISVISELSLDPHPDSGLNFFVQFDRFLTRVIAGARAFHARGMDDNRGRQALDASSRGGDRPTARQAGHSTDQDDARREAARRGRLAQAPGAMEPGGQDRLPIGAPR